MSKPQFETETIPGLPDYQYDSKAGYDRLVDVFSGDELYPAELLYVRPIECNISDDLDFAIFHDNTRIVTFPTFFTANSALERIKTALDLQEAQKYAA